MIPQILIGIWFVLVILVILFGNGESTVDPVSKFFGSIIFLGVLAWGGFFSVWGWPQWVILGWEIFTFALSIALEGRRSEAGVTSLVIALLYIGVIYAGGFFKPSPKPEPTSTITIQVPVNNLTIVRDETSTTYVVRESTENIGVEK